MDADRNGMDINTKFLMFTSKLFLYINSHLWIVQTHKNLKS